MSKTAIFSNKQVQLILLCAAIFYLTAAIITISFTNTYMRLLMGFSTIIMLASTTISFSLLFAEKEETKTCCYPLMFCDFLFMCFCFIYIVLTQIFVPGMKPHQAQVQTGINTAIYTLYFAVSFGIIIIQKMYRQPITPEEQMPLVDQSSV